MERQEKVERICSHIKEGRYIINGDNILVNDTLRLRYIQGGRDHNHDYQVYTTDGSCGKYVDNVFALHEVNLLFHAFEDRKKQKVIDFKKTVFNDIKI